jgi:hypothetical protein
MVKLQQSDIPRTPCDHVEFEIRISAGAAAGRVHLQSPENDCATRQRDLKDWDDTSCRNAGLAKDILIAYDSIFW